MEGRSISSAGCPATSRLCRSFSPATLSILTPTTSAKMIASNYLGEDTCDPSTTMIHKDENDPSDDLVTQEVSARDS